MEVGIIGLPNVGKSTLFNALTKAHAEIGLYPFTTVESNTGMAVVPDERLEKIAGVLKPEKKVPATVKFVDIAGLVKGASKGEGLGNQFLSFIRTVDVIVHVVRLFETENIPSSGNLQDPAEDVETVNLELTLADLEIIQRRIDKTANLAKSGDKEAKDALCILESIKKNLEKGMPARNAGLNADEWQMIADVPLLTAKPVIYVANVSEEQDDGRIEKLKKMAGSENTEVIPISAEIEAELAELSPEEAAEFKQELGLTSTGLERLVKASYKLLELITFYTVVSNENRAWPVKQDTTAYEAAGKIHTDMQKGFIKAEVVNWENLVTDGSLAATRDKGHLAIEGRDYVVQDGDVVYFKFGK